MLVLLFMSASGCASAGGTAGVFDVGSVWYKHPTTGDVKECGGGFYPGVQIRRYNCGNRYLAQGYIEVENCRSVSPGTPCITESEKRRAEAAEKGEASAERAWVLWRAVLDSTGQPMADQWSPIKAFDSRPACEVEQSRTASSHRCLPDTIDPRGPKGGTR